MITQLPRRANHHANQSYTSKVITFDAAARGEAPDLNRMFLKVEFWQGEYTVFQIDLDKVTGKPWNSTPCRGFGQDFEAAEKWAKDEAKKSLV